MPKNFCLQENYEECALFLQKFRSNMLNSLRKRLAIGAETHVRRTRLGSFIDFATIERCSPAAALVLAAEFDRAKSLIEWDIPLVNFKTWRRDLVELLDEIGFFELLEINRPANHAKRSDVTVVRFQTGQQVGNTIAGPLLDVLAGMIAGLEVGAGGNEETVLARMRLYDALVEATENTVQHAYPENFGDACTVRRWWMTGAVDSRENRLTLVVYDQGATVPARLPDWELYPKLKRWMNLLFQSDRPADGDVTLDSVALRLAMTTPRSSTGETHRGKGFPAFLTVIRECKRGRLRVVSRCAEFTFETGRKARSRQLTNALGGTLVEWDLWL